MAEARSRVGQRVALQGNLDPAILLAAPAVIRHEASRVLISLAARARLQPGPRHHARCRPDLQP
jgi:uroporphyrinogen-III decarboxylase